MSRLLFFILMPLIFEGIMLGLNEAGGGWGSGNLKKEIGLFSILLLLDYAIETIYLVIIKNILGVWIFEKDFETIESYGTYEAFKICAIIYIVPCVLVTFVSINDLCIDHFPAIHSLVLTALFVVFCCITVPLLHEEIDKTQFKAMEYTVEENTIYLKALGDGHTTTGSVNGKMTFGSGYIQGNISDNYNLYYAYEGSNGETVIDSLIYNKDLVNIFEKGPDCIPRLVIIRHFKEYKTDYNTYSDEYYSYDIYIPSISNEINIDME